MGKLEKKIIELVCIIGQCNKPDLMAHVEHELRWLQHTKLENLKLSHIEMIVEFLSEMVTEII